MTTPQEPTGTSSWRSWALAHNKPQPTTFSSTTLNSAVYQVVLGYSYSSTVALIIYMIVVLDVHDRMQIAIVIVFTWGHLMFYAINFQIYKSYMNSLNIN